MARSRSILVGAALAVLLGACAPVLDLFGRDAGPTAFVTLPSGERCAHAGEGATLAFDGDRLGWTCAPVEGGLTGLLGSPQVGDDGVALRWRYGAVGTAATGGFVLTTDTWVEGPVITLELADGARCTAAGEGATLTLGERRVAYTCGGDVVVLAPLEVDDRGLLATRAEVVPGDAGLTVVRPARVRVHAASFVAPIVAGPVGTTWALQRILRPNGTVSVPAEPERYTLTLFEDGSATLRADCNRGVGRFELDGAGLTLGPFATTKALCPEGSLDVAFLVQLNAVSRYRLEGDELVLETDAGGTLWFTPAEP